MTGQANFLQSLGWAVLNSLWQLALLWVIYQVFTGVFKTARSSVKSSMASSLLIGGFGWFIYTFFSAYTAFADKTIVSSAFINTGTDGQVNHWLQQTLPIASILYLSLLLLPILHFVRNYRYVQVVRKYGLTKMNVEWRMFVSKVSLRMGIKKTVRLWVSEFVSSPVTIGFLKPVILVPMAAINHLTPQQLEAVLLHELSHIKRFDYLINLIINFIQAILYFNPFVKAFVKIVEREREKSCDEMVLQFQYDSHEYASALLTLEKANHASQPLTIAAGGKKNDLLQRIELIMGVRKKPVLSFNKLAGLMAGLLCIIALNTILIISKPANNGNRGISFSNVHLPLHFISSNAVSESPIATEVAKTATIQSIEHSADPIINHAEAEHRISEIESSLPAYVSSAVNPGLINASLEKTYMPALKKYQEGQVEYAIESSKKIIESVQWKAVEKSIADVFNQQEKDELKATYEKAMEKFDWQQWENDLKLAYNKIDWEKINTQLSLAVTQVRLDSIQTVYNKAISKLDGARKELTINNMNGIPDTDISLKEIQRQKVNVQRALNELKAVRSKKIVHL